MIVYIDRQHSGQVHKIDSRGAGVDLDGNGTKEAQEMEAHWTGYLSLMLESNLIDMGYKVIPISDGTYSQRHDRVNEYSQKFDCPQVYLAMHLNAGGGNYGAMFYDHRSEMGVGLARHICDSLADAVDEIPQFKHIEAHPDNWTKNAYHTIKGIGKPVAICSEPIFMDTHKHLISLQGFAKIALGMAVGIREWSKTL